MTGYQEVLTDPSYFGQIVVFTATQIGNYGVHADDSESASPRAVGAVTRAVCTNPSHAKMSESLPEFLARHGRFGLTGVDTRELTLVLREEGALRGWFTTEVGDPEEAIRRARQVPRMCDVPAVSSVTTKNPYVFTEGDPAKRVVPGSDRAPRVAALDFGVKENILRELARRGCRVEVLPANTTIAQLAKAQPDGVVLSNGPGDPAALEALVPFVREVIDRYPTLAICLGHQLVGMALGGRTLKLSFGHHGANHPVQDVTTGAVSITSQNHNYAIDPDTIPSDVEVGHINLNDGTVQGLMSKKRKLISVQFHPEASPGPHECNSLFDRFADMLGETPSLVGGTSHA